MSNQQTSPPLPTSRNARNDTGGFARLASRNRAEKLTTPERILTSAERLFARHGFDGVTMPMVAAASGITAGAIYKHFDSKSDLFFQVVKRVVQSTPIPAAASESDPTLLPRIVANLTTPKLKRLRQLAVEIHYASVKHPKVRQLLTWSLEHNIQQIRTGVAAMQRAGKLDQSIDSQSLACVLMVFIMGLMHMETLLPQLIGDPKWHEFVQDRVA
ncbi:MAG: TetR/AcrR family transcriptional regulator, partial [Verrucomicrobia bacterium]|nr:TetR/AcrR family transcriptional regulator [Verrucomicrobiota bacterium]